MAICFKIELAEEIARRDLGGIGEDKADEVVGGGPKDGL